MTKEEFEDKILLNSSTAEEYEERRLRKDLFFYYDFRMLVDIISKTLHEEYDKKLLVRLFGRKVVSERLSLQIKSKA